MREQRASTAPTGGDGRRTPGTKQRAFHVGAALLVTLGMASCVDPGGDGVSMHVLCNLQPNESCERTTSAECFAYGKMNLNSIRARPAMGQYYAYPSVESGLIPRATDLPLQSDPNHLQIQRAEVELQDAAGFRLPFDKERCNMTDDLPNPFSVAVTGSVTPGGVGTVQVLLVPSAYTQCLFTVYDGMKDLQGGADVDQTLEVMIAKVVLDGTTSGGVEVSSGTWTWPIEVGWTEDVCFEQSEDATEEETVCSQGQDNNYKPTCSNQIMN